MPKSSAVTTLSLLLLTLAGSARGDSRDTRTSAPKRISSTVEVLDHGVVFVGGTVERLAWSGPLDWSVDMPRALPGTSLLTVENVRELPLRPLPARPVPPGLLSMRRQLGSQDFTNTMGIAGAEPSREIFVVGPPGMSRAFGGGALPTFSPSMSRALDHVGTH